MVKHALLWLILPVVWGWARSMEQRALRRGRPLKASECRLARRAGVAHPEHIRVLMVEEMPMVGLPWMRNIAARWGLDMDGVLGLCLRYGIFLRRCRPGQAETLLHECVHTAQYERLGGLAAFLIRYMRECLEHGYANAPMEREAEGICRGLSRHPTEPVIPHA